MIRPAHTISAIAFSAACASLALAADFSFAPPLTTALTQGHTPTAVRLGDLDGDGKLDAVVTGRNWTGQSGTFGHVAVLRGVGNGTFTSWPDILVDKASTEDAFIGDFDGDGKKDVMLTLSGTRGRAAFARGHGDGIFDSLVEVDLERQPRGMCVADFDGNGALDVAAINYGSSSLQLLHNTLPSGGGLALAETNRLYPYLGGLPYPLTATAADMNVDGKIDIFVTALGAGRLSVIRRTGNGRFAPIVDWKPANVNDENPAVIGASIADYDNDGDPDIALPVLLISQSQKVIVLTNDGQGNLSQQSNFDLVVFAYSWCSAPIDVDGDGRRDIAVGTALSGEVIFLRNETSGPGAPINMTFQPLLIPYGVFVRDLVSADIDGDGDQDLAGVEIAGGSVFVLINQTPQGGVANDGVPRILPPKKRPPLRTSPQLPFVHIDLNGDHKIDALDVARALEQNTLPPQASAGKVTR